MLGVAIMIILLAAYAMLGRPGRLGVCPVQFAPVRCPFGWVGSRCGFGRERISPGPGTKWWERVSFCLWLLNGAVFAVASLDGADISGRLPSCGCSRSAVLF